MERLQIIEQRLLTRRNLLDIADRLDVLEDQNDLTPDEIVEAMESRTRISNRSGRNEATLMQISFEARTARKAAEVLNEYLKLIQQNDLSIRQGRAGQTMDFFEVEVDRLAKELQQQSGRILAFKSANSDALPDSLEFRQSQRAALQERLEGAEREIFRLRSQRQQLIALFNQNVSAGTAAIPLTPAETRLSEARTELDSALLLYSDANPRVKLLKSKIAQLEKAVEAERENVMTPVAGQQTKQETGNPQLNLQLAEIDTRITTLEEQTKSTNEKLISLTDTIDRTPANAIALDELQRKYENLQQQYATANNRLAQASTGERIEILSRGERISIIEQPAIPSRPTKPNRIKIAGAGSMMGIMAGLGLIFLLEFMNRAPKRPEDIIKKLDVWPMATIPYTRTRRELFVQRGRKLAVILVILVGGPIAVWAVHEYYLPLDLLAEKTMNKLGVRW